ncbi:man(5)GlcNAc(2)-PP-dolichol translocation protein RFT1 [Lepeophtheirus salmonis]|uniref:man(5)GlcNAc(2)-PP-dolichol translocation protein RFT1 n=1 Tax=Lepeophtheirus salmonis TaxID=72036 RepID=UPI001AE214C3|nr:protein RFT1 homolog [Lepeophtheirus salmonis]
MSSLAQSIKATSLNILTSILFRIITFILNIFILRHTSKDVLGIVNVRFNLLDDTILFLSREAFRRSCLKIPVGHRWKRIINVIWLGVPITLFWSCLLGSIWIKLLTLPKNFEDQYISGVYYIICSTWIQSFSEVFFVIGQAYFFAKLRATADFLWILVRCLVFASAVYTNPDSAIAWGGKSHFIATLCYTLIYVLYFTWYSRFRPTERRDPFPFKSIKEFIPQKGGFEWERLRLALSFYKQGMLKMILTEGERYLMTFFDLLNFAEQGVFDAVSNLGSLAARFVFRNIEEGAFLYFNQILSRNADTRGEVSKDQKEKEKEAGKHLYLLLRGMTLIGLIFVTFGFSYSHFLLHLYGGINLSSGVGPFLLRTHCVLVLFLAINGVAECFVFAKMSQSEIDSFNFKMICISGIFLSSAIVFVKIFGAPGFIFANIFNFALRITHHTFFISNKFSDGLNPIRGMFPPKDIIFVLFLSGIICSLSEVLIYPSSQLVHLLCGGIVFILTLYIIASKEDHLRSIFVNKWNKKFKKL